MSRKASEVSAAYASLASHVRRQTRDSDDAEDIVQESWLRMAQAERRGPIANLGAYLRTIAANLIRDRHRRMTTGIEIAVPEEVLVNLPEVQPGPEAQLITRDELRRMEAVIAAMPSRPREVFRLARIEGLSFAEIGRRLGISRQTVHEHMMRALLDIQTAADGDFRD